MGLDAWFTLGVVGLVLGRLAFRQLGPDVVLLGGLALLLLSGTLTAPEALAGLANEGMVAVAILFVVEAGVFVGIVDSVVDLQKIRGLLPASDQVFTLDSPRSERCLIEGRSRCSRGPCWPRRFRRSRGRTRRTARSLRSGR